MSNASEKNENLSATRETNAMTAGLSRLGPNAEGKAMTIGNQVDTPGEEVLARIRALLRRSVGHAKSEFLCGPVRLDSRTGRVTVDGAPSSSPP